MDLPLNPRFRALITGFPKSGKSGSIVAFLRAGFRVIYCDFDGNPEPLGYAGVEARKNLILLPFEDKLRKVGDKGRLAGVSGEPKAYLRYMEFLETGKYVSPDGEVKEDHGPMTGWGPDTLFVTDSMTRMIDAIWNRYLYCKGATQKTKRDWGAIVDEVNFVVTMTNAQRLSCHSLMIAHFQLVGAEEMEEDDNSGKRSELIAHNNELKAQKADLLGPRLFPKAVTKAQSEVIAARFPCIIPAEVDSSGRRVFNLSPRQEVPVAIPALTRQLPKSLPIDGGLLDIFEAVTGLREPPKE